MDRYYSQSQLNVKPLADAYLTGFTSLFIASKNSEIEPLSLSDIKNHFLNKNYTREQILAKEREIRHAVNFENEVSTHFEFVLLYIKIWKMGCQKHIKNKNEMFMSTYKFMCEVESAAYDFTKSLITDPEILTYKPSLVVAAIISVTLEIYLKLKIRDRKL